VILADKLAGSIRDNCGSFGGGKSKVEQVVARECSADRKNMKAMNDTLKIDDLHVAREYGCLVDTILHDLWLTVTSESALKCRLTRGKLMRGKVLQSCGTKCDKPHGSLCKLETRHRVFRAREAAAYHGAAFRIWQIPSRRMLARLALAMMGTARGREELVVGWMLVLLGVLAIDSWQGRAGMTAAVSYARGRLLARAWQAWLLRLCAVTS
jgi:hypothetical protein